MEIFRQTPKCESYLRPGVNMDDLERLAQAQTDTEAAIGMQQAKRNGNEGPGRRASSRIFQNHNSDVVARDRAIRKRFHRF